MKNKKMLLLGALLLVAVSVLAGCTAKAPTDIAAPLPTATVTSTATSAATATATVAAATATPNSTAAAEKTFTLEELAKFDGKNGNPAYIAVDGVVYDVTNVPQWRGGTHNGYTAGKDLTVEIKTKSPHGVKMLETVPVVGKLATGT